MEFTNLQSLVETGLTWTGFGVVCGMSAKLILPGRDPGGTFVTFVLGMGGALIGGATYVWATGHPLKEISPIGFAVAIGGALVLLISHRLLGGRMYNRGTPIAEVDEIIVPTPQYTRRRARGARYSDVD